MDFYKEKYRNYCILSRLPYWIATLIDSILVQFYTKILLNSVDNNELFLTHKIIYDFGKNPLFTKLIRHEKLELWIDQKAWQRILNMAAKTPSMKFGLTEMMVLFDSQVNR